MPGGPLGGRHPCGRWGNRVGSLFVLIECRPHAALELRDTTCRALNFTTKEAAVRGAIKSHTGGVLVRLGDVSAKARLLESRGRLTERGGEPWIGVPAPGPAPLPASPACLLMSEQRPWRALGEAALPEITAGWVVRPDLLHLSPPPAQPPPHPTPACTWRACSGPGTRGRSRNEVPFLRRLADELPVPVSPEAGRRLWRLGRCFLLVAT